MKITLAPPQKHQLEQINDFTSDSRVCDRFKAVLNSGHDCQARHIHESTVARHLSDYTLSEKLKPENSGSQKRKRS
ncbi:hypothetical protein VSF3289_04715 [Vibrio scophthalmi]|uniref:Uncharacterized protein n=1 Tax=Vibrio scophthalmi TaxID=45658 RepID=A0A1E3WIE0_9VIBR|nr:hypothetical protein VSF3289_04715 [Vibrio scophthalmi]